MSYSITRYVRSTKRPAPQQQPAVALMAPSATEDAVAPAPQVQQVVTEQPVIEVFTRWPRRKKQSEKE